MGLKWNTFWLSHLCSWLIFRASYFSENFCIIFNEKIHLENKRPVNGIHYLKNQVERPLSHKISNFIILSLLQVMVNRDWIDVFSQCTKYQGVTFWRKQKPASLFTKQLWRNQRMKKKKQSQKLNVQFCNSKIVIL